MSQASDQTHRPEPEFVPTWDELFDLWMLHNPRTGGHYANVPEKIEHELGFLKFYEDVLNNRAPGLTPRGSDAAIAPASLSTPEGNQP